MITTRPFTSILIAVLALVGLQNCAIKRFFSQKLTNESAELWIRKKIKEDVDKYYSTVFKENKKSKRLGALQVKDSVSLDSIRCIGIHQATYYECNLEKSNILQLSMTKDLDNCTEDPVSFQYLMLKKYSVTPFHHGKEDFYVFAVYQQRTKQKDTIIQNFFIGKRAKFNNQDLIHFYKKVYYSKSLNDYKGISLDFYFKEKMTGNSSITIDRIIDRSFNKIGGSRPLVYDLKKLFSEAGLVLQKVND